MINILRGRWNGMRNRCSNPKFKNYCGRGITVCDEWKDFDVFKKWALETGFDSTLQLDRRDNNKGYSPDNCRWVSHQRNSQNRRTDKLNAEDVAVIKGMLQLGVSQKCLCTMYPITSGPMCRIANGTRWGNVIVPIQIEAVPNYARLYANRNAAKEALKHRWK